MKSNLKETGSSSIFVGLPAEFSSTVPFGSIKIASSSWIGGHPFQGDQPEKIFKAFRQTSLTQKVFSSQEDQSREVANNLKVSGSGSSWKGSASLNVRNTYRSSTTKLVCFTEYSDTLGDWIYQIKDLKLRDPIAEIFDWKGKTAAEFKEDLKSFVDIYGYYFVKGYQVRASICINWQIETSQTFFKQEIASEISASFSSGGKSFELTNDLIISSTSKKKDCTQRTKINAFGVNKTPTSAKACDDIIGAWDSFTDPDTAAISKINIVSWDAIPDIADRLLDVPKTEEFKDAISVLYAGIVSQEIWNAAFLIFFKMGLIEKTAIDTYNKPYSNGFWGFFYTKDDLPLNTIYLLQQDASKGIEIISKIKDENFERDFLAKQNYLNVGLEKIIRGYSELTDTTEFKLRIHVDPLNSEYKHLFRQDNIQWTSIYADINTPPKEVKKLTAFYEGFYDFKNYLDFESGPSFFDGVPTAGIERKGGFVYLTMYSHCKPKIVFNGEEPKFGLLAWGDCWDNWGGYQGYSQFIVFGETNPEWKYSWKYSGIHDFEWSASTAFRFESVSYPFKYSYKKIWTDD